jgi:hypothetical protein
VRQTSGEGAGVKARRAGPATACSELPSTAGQIEVHPCARLLHRQGWRRIHRREQGSDVYR